ncbi:hypothetical protein F2P81_025202 [Scophthalmus maximus]|uniref:Uncharacterized protein n=1 Tax=Scophthalmus maximus TaxID=52904 RepID=A0A6A4RJF8_SCOMX|nr:hypothetical protein F2P81_025202 [Scophthalmus maximus]
MGGVKGQTIGVGGEERDEEKARKVIIVVVEEEGETPRRYHRGQRGDSGEEDGSTIITPFNADVSQMAALRKKRATGSTGQRRRGSVHLTRRDQESECSVRLTSGNSSSQQGALMLLPAA